MKSCVQLYKTFRKPREKGEDQAPIGATATDVALAYLRLSKAELEELNVKRTDKREYIRKVIETARPSLGRFMSEAYARYDSPYWRDKNKVAKQSDRAWLRSRLEEIVRNSSPTTHDLLDATIMLYRLSRLQRQKD